MSKVKDYKLELTDFEQVDLDKKIKQRDNEIAINMLSEGYKIDSISKVTGLTIAEVE